MRLVYSKAYRYYRQVIHAECVLKKLTRTQKAALIQLSAKPYTHAQEGGSADLSHTVSLCNTR